MEGSLSIWAKTAPIAATPQLSGELQADTCIIGGGIAGLTTAYLLALEGRPHNIRVLMVCPAATDTEVWEGQADPAVRARMMPAAAVADLIAYLLASPRALAYDPNVVRNFNNPWASG